MRDHAIEYTFSEKNGGGSGGILVNSDEETLKGGGVPKDHDVIVPLGLVFLATPSKKHPATKHKTPLKVIKSKEMKKMFSKVVAKR